MQLSSRPLPGRQRGSGLSRALCAALMTGAACVALAGCGGSSGAGGKGTLVVYSAQHPETTASLVAAFTKQTGITVALKNDDEDVLTAQLEQEGSRSPADVFFTENSNWLQQLDDKGLLANVDASTLARVPSRDSAANGKWLGVSGRYSVLIYNPSKISASQLPTSAMDLADPRYKGKLELAPAETDFWPIISSIIRAHGRQAALTWLEGLKANAGSDDHTPDNETLVGDVNKGDADMGLINHYYYFRIRSENGPGSFHAKLAWFAAARPRLRRGHLGRRDPEVSPPPGGGPEVPGLPGQRGRPAGDRAQRELRVPPGQRSGRQSGAAAGEHPEAQPDHTGRDRDRHRRP